MCDMPVSGGQPWRAEVRYREQYESLHRNEPPFCARWGEKGRVGSELFDGPRGLRVTPLRDRWLYRSRWYQS